VRNNKFIIWLLTITKRQRELSYFPPNFAGAFKPMAYTTFYISKLNNMKLMLAPFLQLHSRNQMHPNEAQ